MIPFYHQRGPVHTEDLIRRFMERMEMWKVAVIQGYRYFPPEAGASTVKQRVWTKLPASSNKTLEEIRTFWIEPFL